MVQRYPGLIILSEQFIIWLSVFTSRTHIRGFRAFVDITAVGAVPFYGLVLLENFSGSDVLGEFAVTFLMEFLDLGDLLEGSGDIFKSFFPQFFQIQRKEHSIPTFHHQPRLSG